ncbi:MAG: signal peptidase I [Myxococcaceae bacterium]
MSDAAQKRLAWEERLTSAWAPITLLALALLPYLLCVELFPTTAAWAVPLMRGFAGLMAVYFVAVWGLRLFWPPFRWLRDARQRAHDQIGDIETKLLRARALTPVQRERVVEQIAALKLARTSREREKITEASKTLAELAEKHLSGVSGRGGWDVGTGLVKALALALLLRTILIEPFRIPTGSMIPTLEIGDQIFVNKFLYGVRIPFTNWVPFQIVRAPARGDVIVFNNPVQPDLDFVKRVVGVPGDRVELVDNVVFINGKVQPRERVGDVYGYWDLAEPHGWAWLSAQRYTEHLDGKAHAVLQRQGPPRMPREGPFDVPAGHVFVMGDNRDSSLDSRYGLGGPREAAFVPYGHIKGKAMIVWFAWSKEGWGAKLLGQGLGVHRLFEPVR